MAEFRELITSKQMARFRIKPDAERACVMVEETILRLRLGRIGLGKASEVLQLVAEFFDECDRSGWGRKRL